MKKIKNFLLNNKAKFIGISAGAVTAFSSVTAHAAGESTGSMTPIITELTSLKGEVVIGIAAIGALGLAIFGGKFAWTWAMGFFKTVAKK